MTSHEHEFLLPRVEEGDLLNYVFEDITDPSHRDRWRAFAQSNRKLAREVLKRAHTIAAGKPELQKTIIDEVTYVYAILAATALRLHSLEQSTIAGDAAGEDQQPSGVQHDGQPVGEPAQAQPDL